MVKKLEKKWYKQEINAGKQLNFWSNFLKNHQNLWNFWFFFFQKKLKITQNTRQNTVVRPDLTKKLIDFLKKYINFEKKKIPINKIIEMDLKKTGRLFSFCCMAPVIIAKKNKLIKKFENIGSEIGLLFQIADDLIDYKGSLKKVLTICWVMNGIKGGFTNCKWSDKSRKIINNHSWFQLSDWGMQTTINIIREYVYKYFFLYFIIHIHIFL